MQKDPMTMSFAYKLPIRKLLADEGVLPLETDMTSASSANGPVTRGRLTKQER